MERAEIISIEEERYPVNVECPYCKKKQWFDVDAYNLYSIESKIERECKKCNLKFYFKTGE